LIGRLLETLGRRTRRNGGVSGDAALDPVVHSTGQQDASTYWTDERRAAARPREKLMPQDPMPQNPEPQSSTDSPDGMRE
jgi:hypothetical protein